MHRLLLTPDARPARAGSGYVAVHELFFPVAGIGITDFFFVSAGVSLAPGLDRQYVLFCPKVTPCSTDDLAVAAGMMYVGKGGGEGTGIAYAEATAGDGSGSGTFGIGWGFAGEEISQRPVLVAGFRAPVSRGLEIVSENWFPPNFDPAILSLGWRYTAGRFSADAAVWLPARSDGTVPAFLPWVSFAYGF